MKAQDLVDECPVTNAINAIDMDTLLVNGKFSLRKLFGKNAASKKINGWHFLEVGLETIN